MNTIVLILGVALGLAAAGPHAADDPPPAAVGAPTDGYFYQTTRIADRVHVIARPDALRIPAEGNVEVFEQSDGLIVVDAGGTPVGGARIIEQIRAFSSKPVKYLVYTHWHGDHHLGGQAFREAYPGVHIVSTSATRAAMAGKPMEYLPQVIGSMQAIPGKRDAILNRPMDAEERLRWEQLIADAPLIAKAYESAKITPADTIVDDRLSVPDPVAPVEIAFLGRANTEGDLIVWAPKQRVLATGDIVVTPYPYGTDSYPKDWIEVLEKLKRYDFAVLLPGHGAPQRDRRYLDDLIGLISDIRAQVAPLAKAGVSLDEAQARVQLEPQYQEFCGGRTMVRRFFKQYFVAPMVANAYKEARGEPILQ